MDKTPNQLICPSWKQRYPYRNQMLEYINKISKIEIENHVIIHSKRTFDFESLEQKNKKLSLIINKAKIDTSSYSKHFNELKLNKQLNANLGLLSFKQMTPIQKLTIPHVMNKSNLVGCAQTGSGKTLAYLLPIANLLLSSFPIQIKKFKHGSYPVVLIILPTRELAEQTYREALKIFYNTGIASAVIYGGCPYPPQIDILCMGVDVLIATPGRLKDFLQRQLILLSQIQYVIFDEGDRLLDMGFEKDIDYIVNKFDMPKKSSRVTLMFSATFPNKVINMVNKHLENFATITIGESFEDIENSNANVEQRFYYVKDNRIEAKIMGMHKLLQLIQGKVIVFVNTKHIADSLSLYLREKEYSTFAIHGDKCQEERQAVLAAFSDGRLPLLIATDLASRGLDIPNVDFVINFDFPKNIDDYIHRIGRTGRCGYKGRAISYVNEYDQILFPSIVKLLKKNGQNIPDFLSDYQ